PHPTTLPPGKKIHGDTGKVVRELGCCKEDEQTASVPLSPLARSSTRSRLLTCFSLQAAQARRCGAR
ncbi:MAG: hypothetical protein ACPIOQ_44450, partial [Promethearchaeia archaeon]